MPRLLLILLCTLPGLLAAQVYTWRDAEGVTHFSDQPPADGKARRIEIPPPNVRHVPKAERTAPAAPTAPAPQTSPTTFGGYRSLAIVAPAHDSALTANDGNVTVRCTIDPPLQAGRGHQLRIRLDGRPVAQVSGCEATLENLDRGEHDLQVEVLDGRGQVLLRSEPVHFTLHRHSRLFRRSRARGQL